MGRREEKKDLTRSQILSAATALFADKGYENTAIDDITEKADIAKGTFYYHFDTKEAIVIALRNDSFKETLNHALQLLEDGTKPVDVLEKVLLERAAWTEQNPELAKVFFEQRIRQFLFRENDVMAFAKKTSATKNGQISRFFQLICQLVDAGQKEGELRRDLEAPELTQIIIASFLHAQGSWLGGYSGTSLVDKVHRWLHAILDGLSTEGSNLECRIS